MTNQVPYDNHVMAYVVRGRNGLGGEKIPSNHFLITSSFNNYVPNNIRTSNIAIPISQTIPPT